MTDEHTPPPWYVVRHPWDDTGCTVHSCPDPHGGELVCTTDEGKWHDHTPDDVARWQANAEHIVCCVNSHDALVAACEVAKQLASIASDWNLDKVEIDGDMINIYDVMEVFDAALREARGE